MKTQTVTFTVTGPGMFPIDMLRYDECHPATEQDAAKIMARFTRYMSADCTVPDKSPIKLTRNVIAMARARTWTPTVARWQSFGWTVDPASLTISLRSMS